METKYSGYTIMFNETDEKFTCDIGEDGEENIISAEKISTIKNKIDKIGDAPKQKSQTCIEIVGYGTSMRVRDIKVGTFGISRYSDKSAGVTYKDGKYTDRKKYTQYSLKNVLALPSDSDQLKLVQALRDEMVSVGNEFVKIEESYKEKMKNLEAELRKIAREVEPTIEMSELPKWN